MMKQERSTGVIKDVLPLGGVAVALTSGASDNGGFGWFGGLSGLYSLVRKQIPYAMTFHDGRLLNPFDGLNVELSQTTYHSMNPLSSVDLINISEHAFTHAQAINLGLGELSLALAALYLGGRLISHYHESHGSQDKKSSKKMKLHDLSYKPTDRRKVTALTH